MTIGSWLRKRTFSAQKVDFVGAKCFILLKIKKPFRLPVYRAYSGGDMRWVYRPFGEWVDAYADHETALFLRDTEAFELNRIAENRAVWLKRYVAEAQHIIRGL